MNEVRFPQLAAAIAHNAARNGKPMKPPLLMLNEIVIRQRFHLKCDYAMVRVTHGMHTHHSRLRLGHCRGATTIA